MNRAVHRRWWIGAAVTALAVLTAAAPAAATGSGSGEAVLVNSAGQTITAAQVKSAQSRAAKLRAADARRNPANVAGQDIIIGNDDRTLISPTTSSPYRMIVHVESSIGGCTGFMVSHDTVLTAAHCLYNFHQGWGWGQNLIVRPGRDGGNAPYGSCTGQSWVPVGWVNNGDLPNDLGGVKLTCDIGEQTGWFNIFANDNLSQVNTAIITAGYPGDKPAGTLWRAAGTVVSHTFDMINYSNDIMGGQSGSPLYRWAAPSGCVGYCVAGIVTNHGNETVGNAGLRFNSLNIGHINYWISLP